MNPDFMQLPPPDSLRQQIQRSAFHLATLQAGHGFDDLHPFAHVVGDARIVALGEATHGTREFFLLKHRLVEFLVAELGFNVFAIEANWPESEVVNEYVLYGKGDPAAALAGLRFWTWDTEEVLALIEWMRSWNARQGQVRPVRFAGIDAQFPSHAVSLVREYLRTVDPGFEGTIAPVLEQIEALDLFGEHGDDDTERHLSEAIRELGARLGAEQSLYTARSSSRAWSEALQHVRILCQIDEQRHAVDSAVRFDVRDRAMADNVDHIVGDGVPDARVIVWAHNGHITKDSRGLFDPDVMTMGRVLSERHGDRYLAVGFAFGTGSFQAIVDADSDAAKLDEVHVGAPQDGCFDAVLMGAARTPGFLLDMRQQAGELTEWLHREQLSRETGAVFRPEEDMHARVIPAARYDALAFVRHTTRARPNPTGHRPRR